ncbi:MAG: hypothetical protein GY937_05790, partial [bacterium]|nr:hypothetical protein [bacterium]
MSAVNGREVLTRTDLVVPGVYPIQLSRRYDNKSTYDSPLGYGWSFSHDLKLFEYPDGSVTIRNSCGYRHRFELDGGTLVPKVGRKETLDDLGNGSYVLHYPRGAEAHFNPQGNLSELRDRSGNRLHFEYDLMGKKDLEGTSPFAVIPTEPMTVARVYQLTRIYEQLADTTVTGRDVTFTYHPTSGRLNSALASDGRTVTYTHDTYQVTKTQGNLTEVRLPVDATDAILETYEYSDTDPTDPHNLTSIQLGQGETPWIQVYDAEDRVIQQTRGDCTVACDRVLDFDYSTPLTTVVTRTIKDDTGTVTGTAIETFEYNTQNFLTKRIDALDNEFHYIRDGNGFLDKVEVYLPGGLVLQKTIDLTYGLDSNLSERVVTLDSGEIVTETWTYDDHWVKSYEIDSTFFPNKVFHTDYTFHRAGPDITNIKEIKRLDDDGSVLETT